MTLHAAHIASTETRDWTGVPRNLCGLGLTIWHTANTANKVTILYQVLNGEEEGDIHRMAFTELWVMSQRTGVT